MIKLSKFVLLTILLTSTACAQVVKKSQKAIEPAVAEAELAGESDGLVRVPSNYSVADTTDRLAAIIQEKGLTLFARIDHSANAQKVEAQLNPTQLLIFGNPKVGTPLMNCAATTAIDLPQKILVVQDEDEQTQVIYNAPEYLQQRHNISGCDEVLTKVSRVLEGITAAATN